jgi:hypothetical protein
MNSQQGKILGQLERALGQLAASGAHLHGVDGELMASGEGKKGIRATYQLESAGVYVEARQEDSGKLASIVPLWDFEGNQRRAFVKLEKVFSEVSAAGLNLLGSKIGLLAVEKEKLGTSPEQLAALQDEVVMVNDGGAWR